MTIYGLFFVSLRSFKGYNGIKIIDFCRIQTWIVGVKGEDCDHLTPNTRQNLCFFILKYLN